jgi:hypothetical protein
MLLLGAATWRSLIEIRAPAGTAANSKLLNVKNASGSSVASIDLEGDLVATSVTSSSCFTTTNALDLGSTLDVTGATTLDSTFTTGTAIAGTTLTTIKGIMTWTSGSTDIGSISAASTATQTFTLSGLVVGDIAWLTTSTSAVDAGVGNTIEAGLVFRCFVQMANTISCEFSNNTASPIDPAPRTYTFTVMDLT